MERSIIITKLNIMTITSKEWHRKRKYFMDEATPSEVSILPLRELLRHQRTKIESYVDKTVT